MSGLSSSTAHDLWNSPEGSAVRGRMLFASVPVATFDMAVSSRPGCAGAGPCIRIVHANASAHVLFGTRSPEELARHVEPQTMQPGFLLSVESALRPPRQVRECFGLRMIALGGRELLIKATTVGFDGDGEDTARVLMFLEDTAPSQRMRINSETYQKRLSELVEARNREADEVNRVLLSRDRLAETLVQARSAHTAAHMKRVAVLSEHIGQRLAIGEWELAQLVSAARLHDIGIMHVPMEILTKSGTISKAERAVVQEHPAHARDILSAAGYSAPVLTAVVQHHERYDGTGYPEGLAGDEICPAAKVLAVADVLDAMMAPRAYRPSLSVGDAIANLERQAAGFDPDVLAACKDVCESTTALLPGMADHERAAMAALSPLPAIGTSGG